MARQIVKRPACRRDVDEPKQGRAQIAITGGELHRTCVEGSQRLAGARRKRCGQLVADAPQLCFDALGDRARIRFAERTHAGLAGSAAGWPGIARVARAIASQPVSRWRSACSAAAPPRSPNRRFWNSR